MHVNKPALKKFHPIFRINTADTNQDFFKRSIPGTKINLWIRLGTWLEQFFEADHHLIRKSSPQFIQGRLHRSRWDMRLPRLEKHDRGSAG